MAERKKRTSEIKSDGAEVTNKSIPGRPEGAQEAVEKTDTNRQEVLYMTPKGIMCKKIYEVFRKKPKGCKGEGNKYRRLIQTIKNVKA